MPRATISGHGGGDVSFSKRIDLSVVAASPVMARRIDDLRAFGADQGHGLAILEVDRDALSAST